MTVPGMGKVRFGPFSFLSWDFLLDEEGGEMKELELFPQFLKCIAQVQSWFLIPWKCQVFNAYLWLIHFEKFTDFSGVCLKI